MTRCEELLYSLVAVMIRYHDKQPGVTLKITERDEVLLRKKTHCLAKEIMSNTEIDFKTQLQDLIEQSTKHHDDRKPFLNYLVNEIIFLKSIVDKNSSFSSGQFAAYTTQVIELVTDLKHLLANSKGTKSPIRYHNTDLSPGSTVFLDGLVDNHYYSRGQLCNSGLILKEEILDRFNLTLHAPQAELDEFAMQLCQEHQNILLIPEFTAQLTYNSIPHSAFDNEEIYQLQEQFRAQEEEQKKLHSTIAKQLLTLYQLHEQLNISTVTETRLKETVKRQEETIEHLTQKISDLESLLLPEANSSSAAGFGFFSVAL
ncbi:hypothetical protein [Legionella worsleiensis]|uniref:Uncharacterized protein n=1 Tax=Legionella worsleiensis TaxID=45076 RepID=A0A0W1A911_9GAMM|nr:hypothetical protein [Legionella worsleiensis]KTD77826.1 hypothetical protein Lwor_1708 [Legionella worsleiensis]STY33068.1 Uncharacterised protein [Legionella worsleiensis]